MSKENKLLNTLVNSVVTGNEIYMENMEEVIDEINKRLCRCAEYGYTAFVIQFTKNQNLLPKDSNVIVLDHADQPIGYICLFMPNDAITYKYSESIKKYYEGEGLNITDRHNNPDSLLISWNKDVLNHYGYEF